MATVVGWKPKSDDSKVASVRFRCLSPLAEMQRTGFGVELYSQDRADAGAYSAVIFSKLYGAADRQIAKSLMRDGVRTLLDVSDNHFYNPSDLPLYRQAAAELREMAGLVDRVIACSAHLAGIIAKEASLALPPIVVGDAVEAMRLPLNARDPFLAAPGEPFRIIWFGSHGSPNAPGGMEDILRIVPHLERAQSTRPCELVVISNNTEKFANLKGKLPLSARYVEWSDNALMTEFARANLVVVPVTPNPFTKCKSNNRVATALWHGLPVIADRIPAYDEFAEFAFIGTWEDGFAHAMAASRDARLRTASGSAYVRSHLSIRQIAGDWRKAIKTVLAQPGAVSP